MTDMNLTKYTRTIIAAMRMHRPCRGLVKVVQQAFDALAEIGVEHTPNDFNFQYTGYAEFRWHDGATEHFGSSTRYVGMLCGPNGVDIRGRIPSEAMKIHHDAGNRHMRPGDV